MNAVAGEQCEDQCIVLDKAFLQHSRQNSKDGAVLFVFTDWRNLYGLMTASRDVGLSLKDLVVWAKASAAMGSFYRSGHELVLVLQNGEAVTPDIVKRGRRRRSRTNLWAIRRSPISRRVLARTSPGTPQRNRRRWLPMRFAMSPGAVTSSSIRLPATARRSSRPRRPDGRRPEQVEMRRARISRPPPAKG